MRNIIAPDENGRLRNGGAVDRRETIKRLMARPARMRRRERAQFEGKALRVGDTR
jgi:hypothetical protein